MANTLRIKRRASGAVGAPSTLANAELAFNEVDNTLYYGKGTGGSGGTATTVEAIGGIGAFVGLSGTQTITGNKTFSGTVALGSSATATTPTTGDNTTKLATTAFVQSALSGSGLGTVTSVALTAPSFISVSGSPITSAGTIALSLASQTANQVFAAPNGSNGTPTFRSLVAADIPSLTSTYLGLSTGGTVSGNTSFTGTVSLGSGATATTPSTIDSTTKVATTAWVNAQGYLTSAVSSVGLSLPSIFTVTGSPVTTSGTITGTLASQTANHVFVAPNGSSGTPTFRTLVAADIPSLPYLSTSGGTVSGATTFSGTVALGSSATATTPTIGDNTTKVATTAFVNSQGFLTEAVSSVGLSLPSIFTVTGSPVTSTGTLTGTLASQTANHVFVAPNGSNGTPTFRTLVAADIPSLPYLSSSGGTVSGNLVLTGDLTVNGTTTTINSTTLTVDDKNIVIGDVATPTDVTADGGGITLRGTTDKTLTWVDSTDAWTSNQHFNLASGKAYYIGGTMVLSGTNLDNVTVDGGSF